VRAATWAQIGIYGIGTALHESMLPCQRLMTKMLLTLAGLAILLFVFFFCKCNENNRLQQFIDIRKYNFYIWIFQYKGCIELVDYWPTNTNHKSERATFG
jgi:hypothetical protein